MSDEENVTPRVWVIEQRRLRKGAKWRPYYLTGDLSRVDAVRTAASWNAGCRNYPPALVEYRVRAYRRAAR